MTLDEIREALDAFERDGKIQYLNESREHWLTEKVPTWNFARITYRPVPNKLECWAIVTTTNVLHSYQRSKSDAEGLIYRTPGYKLVHMVEADE